MDSPYKFTVTFILQKVFGGIEHVWQQSPSLHTDRCSSQVRGGVSGT